MSDLTELAIDQVVCPTCEVRRGQPCKTISGAPSSVHTPRIRAIQEAWRVGYGEGMRYALDYPDSATRMLARDEARWPR